MQTLQTLPEGIAETRTLIAQLDALFLIGFAGGRHQTTLESIARVFAGSPLDALLAESSAALARGELQVQHFTALASARAALQGAQYDLLRQQALQVLGRSTDAGAEPASYPAAMPAPMLDGVRSWLMELVVTGFARLEPSALTPFLATLEQLRTQPELARLNYLLTGFTDELLMHLPLTQPDDAPIWRWCDMWSAAMLCAVGNSPDPVPTPVSGTLYPLGMEVRERGDFRSIIVHGLLARAEQTDYVHITRSRYKVNSISGKTAWLLFPELLPLLDALEKGHMLEINALPQLPTGDLLWDAGCVQIGAKVKLLDFAADYLGIAASHPLTIPPDPALDRHPIQLAEPLVLADYTLNGDELHVGEMLHLPLDVRWNADTELDRQALEKGNLLFGLLRFDDARWSFQPLSVATKTGKLTFAGQGGVKILAKPPKNNPVPILQERASKLLRK